jgi:hypothetical protein
MLGLIEFAVAFLDSSFASEIKRIVANSGHILQPWSVCSVVILSIALGQCKDENEKIILKTDRDRGKIGKGEKYDVVGEKISHRGL